MYKRKYLDIKEQYLRFQLAGSDSSKKKNSIKGETLNKIENIILSELKKEFNIKKTENDYSIKTYKIKKIRPPGVYYKIILNHTDSKKNDFGIIALQIGSKKNDDIYFIINQEEKSYSYVKVYFNETDNLFETDYEKILNSLSFDTKDKYQVNVFIKLCLMFLQNIVSTFKPFLNILDFNKKTKLSQYIITPEDFNIDNMYQEFIKPYSVYSSFDSKKNTLEAKLINIKYIDKNLNNQYLIKLLITRENAFFVIDENKEQITFNIEKVESSPFEYEKLIGKTEDIEAINKFIVVSLKYLNEIHKTAWKKYNVTYNTIGSN